MTTQLEQEIEAARQLLLAMARHAEAAVARAVRALVEGDGDLARSVIADDGIVDHCEVEIDERVINLLSKALLGADLRLMIVTMKISHDLERVADEATTIARRAIAMDAKPEPAQAAEIQRIAGRALAMLKEAVEGFASRQPEKALAVIPRDDEVDALNRRYHRELTAQMQEQRGGVNDCVSLMVVSKSLERVADHAVSIAEEAVYLCEGEDIRHASHGDPAASA
jgi:phosphate transport system protein